MRASGVAPVPPAIDDRSLLSVVWATRQPSPGAPSRFSPGMRTPSRNTSEKWASPVICRSGRTSMPGVDMSSRK